ncbi:hypothetical protein [Paenibacillus xylanilyticus]|uniref:HEPN AbiU2-like domain-containing protein n=1 Tax=Paenibacillus xylanilyticus TaxID=248903 RepID=A0A7Y6EZN5_9BACL|nr:hypothetical protein [Paenibacillus xylanilyticus]NUU80063.1 hypothetical protein [Paenibacillus xylanilyticus]
MSYVVSMGRESFNDALKYVSEAKECYSDERTYGMWSASRAAMFSMCLSAESELSRLIVKSLEKIGESNWTTDQRSIYRYLTEYTKENESPPDCITTIARKYKQVLSINGKEIEKVRLPQGYRNASMLRNKITHYSFSKNHSVFSMNILDELEKFINEIRIFLKHIFAICDLEYPHWIDKDNYVTLDKKFKETQEVRNFEIVLSWKDHEDNGQGNT